MKSWEFLQPPSQQKVLFLQDFALGNDASHVPHIKVLYIFYVTVLVYLLNS